MAKRPDHSVPGILVIDKASGMTSHDVVSRVRRLAHTRKVGHGGTLDPMATGVLVVGVGKATRLLTFITGHSKTYEATIRFGLTTSTDDAEGALVRALGCASLSLNELEKAMEGLRGEIDQVPSSVSAKKIDGKRAYELVREGVLVVGVGKATRLLTFITGHSKTYEATIRFGLTTSTDDAEGALVRALGCASLSLNELEKAMEGLRGEIDQVPSSVSAKKIDGKRAYELVREGVEVELKANRVTVSRFERCSDLRRATLDTSSGPLEVLDVDVVVDCSSGTYIRALARDLGLMLGVGAHLTRLRRTRVGAFTLEDCRTVDSLEDEAASSRAASHPKMPLPAPTPEGALKSASHSEEPLPAPGLIPLGAAVTAMFPVIFLNEAEAARFLHGNPPKRGPKELQALLRAAPVHRASVPPTPEAPAAPVSGAPTAPAREAPAASASGAPAAPAPGVAVPPPLKPVSGAPAAPAPGVAVPPPLKPVSGAPAAPALGVAVPPPLKPVSGAPVPPTSGAPASPSLEAPNPSSPRTSAKDALATTMLDHGAGLNARTRGETAPVLVDGDTTIFAAADPKGRILGLIDASKPRLKTICVFFGGEG